MKIKSIIFSMFLFFGEISKFHTHFAILFNTTSEFQSLTEIQRCFFFYHLNHFDSLFVCIELRMSCTQCIYSYIHAGFLLHFRIYIMLSKRLVTSLLARNGGISQVTKVRNGIQLARCCSTQGAQQTLKVKQKIEEKREAALLGGWLFLLIE